MVTSITITVTVEKSLQGKVVGRGGATIRDIESDYPGVKVIVPRRNDPSTDVVIVGPPDAVRRAEARVKDISGVNVDKGTRKKVDALRKEKDRLFSEAAKAKGQRRHKLLDQAHSKKREMDAAEAKAAQQIFAAKNSGYGLDQVDLHGLHVREAMLVVQKRLGILDSGQINTLEVITGAGHHSTGHRAKIRPAVEDMLRSRRYKYRVVNNGAGFLVTGKQSAGLSSGAQSQRNGVSGASGFFERFISFLCSCFTGGASGGSSAGGDHHRQQSNKNRRI